MAGEKEIRKIWSEGYWRKEARRIELAYWTLLKDKVPNVKPPKVAPKTEHRIEAFVRQLSLETDIGNLHVGLTSSDLEDNIRAKRLEDCVILIEELADVLYDQTKARIEDRDKQIIAYTHLMPAGITTIYHRFNYSLADGYKSPIVYKGIGGALGDFKIQEKLGLDRNEVNRHIFFGKECQETSNQTVTHVTEYEVASWIAWHASTMAKTANNVRQMFALGQAQHSHQDIGSTAIPLKKPNPWRYERVSGMAEHLYDLPAKVARIASSCLLERTLNNQSVLNHMFEDAFVVLAEMYNDMIMAFRQTEFIDQSKEAKERKYHTEELMLEEVLRGIPRLAAHLKINKKYS